MYNPQLSKIETKLSQSSSVSYHVTGDFEQQASLLNGWNQDYAQLSSGDFNGYVAEMRFDDLHLFLEYSSQSLFQSGHLAEDTIAVGVPLSFIGNGLFCGSACNHQSMHIFSGNNGFEFFSPSHLLMAGISVNRDTLFNTLNAEDGELALQHLSAANLLNLDSSKIKSVAEFMTGAFDMLQKNPELLQIAQNKTRLRQGVLSLITECLVESNLKINKTNDQISHAKCSNIIAETRVLVFENLEMPMSVAEVCKHLGVSRRTLQYCFQNLLNTTPMAYLRAERLNGVRAMLRSSNSVTEAAAHWGFWHFGHFSQEYKKMFGELPSITFKRLHSH